MTSTDVRHKLDNWKLWMGIAYFGLVAVVVVLTLDWSRTNAEVARTTRIVAARHAEVVANADAQYQQCVKSIPLFTRVNNFIRGVERIERALLQNSEASHLATPPGSALYDAQVTNIIRLREAIRAARQVAFHVPSMQQCRELRARLNREN